MVIRNVNMKALFPLPFQCGHERYIEGALDAHRNPVKDWSAPEPQPCSWWSPWSRETPHGPIGGDRVQADMQLALDAELQVDHRDRFIIGGQRFEVIGLATDYNHGPFGVSPGRVILNLRWIG